jgi:hypothetical protein
MMGNRRLNEAAARFTAGTASELARTGPASVLGGWGGPPMTSRMRSPGRAPGAYSLGQPSGRLCELILGLGIHDRAVRHAAVCALSFGVMLSVFWCLWYFSSVNRMLAIL